MNLKKLTYWLLSLMIVLGGVMIANDLLDRKAGPPALPELSLGSNLTGSLTLDQLGDILLRLNPSDFECAASPVKAKMQGTTAVVPVYRDTTAANLLKRITGENDFYLVLGFDATKQMWVEYGSKAFEASRSSVAGVPRNKLASTIVAANSNVVVISNKDVRICPETSTSKFSFVPIQSGWVLASVPNGFFSSDVTAVFDVFKGQEVQIDPVTGLKKGQYWLYVDAPEGLVFGEKDSQSSVASSSAGAGSGVGSGANRSGSGVGSGAAESDGAGADDSFVQEALAAGTQMGFDQLDIVAANQSVDVSFSTVSLEYIVNASYALNSFLDALIFDSAALVNVVSNRDDRSNLQAINVYEGQEFLADLGFLLVNTRDGLKVTMDANLRDLLQRSELRLEFVFELEKSIYDRGFDEFAGKLIFVFEDRNQVEGALPSVSLNYFDDDSDLIPNAFDNDWDNDGVTNQVEFDCLSDPEDNSSVPTDNDGDKLCDELDEDDDNDGLSDLFEGSRNNRDSDADGRPNHLDRDSDDDGFEDGFEVEKGMDPYSVDSDGDGIDDNVEGAVDGPDGDGVVNAADTDSDGDEILDAVEGAVDGPDADGFLNYLDTDSDGDGIDDAVEGAVDGPDTDGALNYLDTDSDGDGIDDAVEGEADVDEDLIPNFLDLDSDGDDLIDQIEFLNGLDPFDADMDNDGLSDFEEVGADAQRDPLTETDPTRSDTDGDRLTDLQEVGADGVYNAGLETNPLDPDTDGDGLDDGVEDANRDGVRDETETDPRLADTDSDGLDDGVEDANRNGIIDEGETDPRVADTDGDGLDDKIERDNGTNPRKEDSDDDGLSDLQEVGADGVYNAGLETNPLDPDTDGDGLDDGVEDANRDGVRDETETDPRLADTDSDGLDDGVEDVNRDGVRDETETDPRLADTDGDGLDDKVEEDNVTDPLLADTDGDELSDLEEIGPEGIYHQGTETNPNVADTDGDTFNDNLDVCPLFNSDNQTDTDGDGIGDECDDDSDGDGINDDRDNCLLVVNPDQANNDNDADGDACDDDNDDDTVVDVDDNCPFNANLDQSDLDRDEIGDVCDDDVDGDSINNDVDDCDDTELNANVTVNGCNDLDEDGVAENGPGILDNCPEVSNEGQVDFDGDLEGDVCDDDDDNDGVLDDVDDCDDTGFNLNVAANGCNDLDEDGVAENGPGTLDNCPVDENADQSDLDRDEIGDVCDDDKDGDEIENAQDVCPTLAGQASANGCPDVDGDGVPNVEVAGELDNCPVDANVDQTDTDSDGIGDECDDDDDNDTEDDEDDNCPLIANQSQDNFDDDLEGDVCDDDDDNDGVDDVDDECVFTTLGANIVANGCIDADLDGVAEDGPGELDNCPVNPNADQADIDDDEIGDVCDDDLDGDSVNNDVDNCPEVVNFEQNDLDQDRLGDLCDEDKDGDGLTVEQEGVVGTSDMKSDSDGDGLSDLEEVGFNKVFDAGFETNPVNADTDGDGYSDGDLVPEGRELLAADNCPLILNEDQSDLDGDGVGDVCDGDTDNDGVDDIIDNCVDVVNPGQENLDGDVYGDACDNDKDGDNLTVEQEAELGTSDDDADSDDDGVLDKEDLFPLLAHSYSDWDGDGIGDGDELETDSDNDGVPDNLDACPLSLSQMIGFDEIANFVTDEGCMDEDNDGVFAYDLRILDFDQDGVNDFEAADDPVLYDNCEVRANADQLNSDEGRLGDECDDLELIFAKGELDQFDIRISHNFLDNKKLFEYFSGGVRKSFYLDYLRNGADLYLDCTDSNSDDVISSNLAAVFEPGEVEECVALENLPTLNVDTNLLFKVSNVDGSLEGVRLNAPIVNLTVNVLNVGEVSRGWFKRLEASPITNAIVTNLQGSANYFADNRVGSYNLKNTFKINEGSQLDIRSMASKSQFNEKIFLNAEYEGDLLDLRFWNVRSAAGQGVFMLFFNDIFRNAVMPNTKVLMPLQRIDGMTFKNAFNNAQIQSLDLSTLDLEKVGNLEYMFDDARIEEFKFFNSKPELMSGNYVFKNFGRDDAGNCINRYDIYLNNIVHGSSFSHWFDNSCFKSIVLGENFSAVYDVDDDDYKKGRTFVKMFANMQLEKLDLNQFFDLLSEYEDDEGTYRLAQFNDIFYGLEYDGTINLSNVDTMKLKSINGMFYNANVKHVVFDDWEINSDLSFMNFFHNAQVDFLEFDISANGISSIVNIFKDAEINFVSEYPFNFVDLSFISSEAMQNDNMALRFVNYPVFIYVGDVTPLDSRVFGRQIILCDNPNEWCFDRSFLDDFDPDSDGIPFYLDNCPLDANELQEDIDEDGTGDVCDALPEDKFGVLDTDGDGVGDRKDLWPDDSSRAFDADFDGIDDVSDDDDDNDGVLDVDDKCPRTPLHHSDQVRRKNVDGCLDMDEDGLYARDIILDTLSEDELLEVDNCDYFANPLQTDTDRDGIGDECEPMIFEYEITEDNLMVKIGANGRISSVDWGDGTVNAALQHTYAQAGFYTVKVYGSDDLVYLYPCDNYSGPRGAGGNGIDRIINAYLSDGSGLYLHVSGRCINENLFVHSGSSQFTFFRANSLEGLDLFNYQMLRNDFYFAGSNGVVFDVDKLHLYNLDFWNFDLHKINTEKLDMGSFDLLNISYRSGLFREVEHVNLGNNPLDINDVNRLSREPIYYCDDPSLRELLLREKQLICRPVKEFYQLP